MEQRAYKEQNRNLSHDNETGHTVAVHNSIEEDNNIILETEFSTLQSNQPEVVPYLSQSSREQESTETTNCNLSLPDATHRNLSLPDTTHRKLSLSDDETEIIVNQKGSGDNIDEEDSQGSSADIRAAHSSSSIQTTTDPSSGSSDTSGVASSNRSNQDTTNSSSESSADNRMAPSSSNTQDNEKTVQSLNSRQSNPGMDNNALVW